MTNKKITDLTLSNLSAEEALDTYIPISGTDGNMDELFKVNFAQLLSLIAGNRQVVPHEYWRVYFDQNNGAAACGLSELQFFKAGSTTNLITLAPGTPISSAGTPALAFDNGASGNGWFDSVGSSGAWIGYQFSQPVGVIRVKITAAQFTDQSPENFRVQYSDDGQTWTDAFSVTGEANWITNEVRQYVDTSPEFLPQTTTVVAEANKRIWAVYDGTTSTLKAGNGLSFVRTGTGFYVVTFDVPRADTNYAILLGGADMGYQFGSLPFLAYSSKTVDGFQLNCFTNQDNSGDVIMSIEVVDSSNDTLGGFTDAPSDGSLYLRKNGAWYPVSASGSEDRTKVSALITNTFNSDGSYASSAVTSGLNVSGVVRTAQGRYRVSFTNSLDTVNYGLNASARFTDNADTQIAAISIDRNPSYGFTVQSIDFEIAVANAPTTDSGVYDPEFFSFEIYDPAVASGGGSATDVAEAPVDQTSYVRKNSAWVRPSTADLTDIDYTTAVTDGQALIWNATEGKYVPGNVTTGVTYPAWAPSQNSHTIYETMTFDSGVVPANLIWPGTPGTIVSDPDVGGGTTNALRFGMDNLGNGANYYFDLPVHASNGDNANVLTVRSKTNGEGGYDGLTIYLDGTVQYQFKGSQGDFVGITITMPDGDHTVRFQYTSDISITSGYEDTHFSQIIYPELVNLSVYRRGDTVGYNGDTYFCEVDYTPQQPGTGTDWSKFFGTVALAELTDVDISTTPPTNGQALVWNSAQNKFLPGTGFTDAPLDGNVYGRENGAWVPAGGSGGSSSVVPATFADLKQATNEATFIAGTQPLVSTPPGYMIDLTMDWGGYVSFVLCGYALSATPRTSSVSYTVPAGKKAVFVEGWCNTYDASNNTYYGHSLYNVTKGRSVADFGRTTQNALGDNYTGYDEHMSDSDADDTSHFPSVVGLAGDVLVAQIWNPSGDSHSRANEGGYYIAIVDAVSNEIEPMSHYVPAATTFGNVSPFEAPEIVQTGFGRSKNANTTITLTNAPTAGNMLAAVWCGSGGNTPGIPAGWAPIQANYNGNAAAYTGQSYQGCIVFVRRVVSTDTATFTLPGGADLNNWFLMETTDFDTNSFSAQALAVNGTAWYTPFSRGSFGSGLHFIFVEEDITGTITFDNLPGVTTLHSFTSVSDGFNHCAAIAQISDTFAGDITGTFDTAPTYPFVVQFGFAKYTGTGVVTAGLGDLSNVDLHTKAPTNGQALVWNTTDAKWEPGSVAASSSGGGMPRTLAAIHVDCSDSNNPVISNGFNVASIAKTQTGTYKITFTNPLTVALNKVGFSDSGKWSPVSGNQDIIALGLDRNAGITTTDVTVVTHTITSTAANGTIYDCDGWFSFELFDVTIGENSGGASALADLTDVDLATAPTDGQALVWNTTASKWEPGSVAASSGGGAGDFTLWGYNPPKASDYSLFGTVTPTITDATNGGGLLFDLGAPASGDVSRFAVKPLASGDFTYIIHHKVQCNPGNYQGFGIVLYDSVGGKVSNFRHEFDANNYINGPQVGHNNFPAGFVSTGVVVSSQAHGFFSWLRVSRVGTNLNFYASDDGQQWALIGTEVETNFLTVPANYIGFGGFYNNTGAITDLTASIYYAGDGTDAFTKIGGGTGSGSVGSNVWGAGLTFSYSTNNGPIVINSSSNIASVTRVSGDVGKFLITFTDAAPDANWVMSGVASCNPTPNAANPQLMAAASLDWNSVQTANTAQIIVGIPNSEYDAMTVRLTFIDPAGMISLGGGTGGVSSLTDLTDVDLTTAPTDGQALVWSDSDGKFIPGSVASSEATSVKYFGLKSIMPNTAANAATQGFWGGQPVIVDSNTSIDAVMCCAPAAQPGISLIPAIYSANADGTVGTLIGTGSAKIGTTAGINELLLGAPLTVAAGTLVYVGIQIGAVDMVLSSCFETDSAYFANTGLPPQVAPAATYGTNAWSSMWARGSVEGTTAPVGGSSSGGLPMLYDLSKGVPLMAGLTTFGNSTKYTYSENPRVALNVSYTGAATGPSIGGFAAPVPASPFHVAFMNIENLSDHNFYSTAVGFYNSATGKYQVVKTNNAASANGFELDNFSAVDTRDSLSAMNRGPQSGEQWFHIKYDGTSVYYGWSRDGVNAMWCYSNNPTSDYLGGAPTHFVFGLYAEGSDVFANESVTYLCVDTDAGSRKMGTTASGGGAGASALTDLTDVDLTTAPTDGQALVWSATESKFHPGTVAAATTPITTTVAQMAFLDVSTSNSFTYGSNFSKMTLDTVNYDSANGWDATNHQYTIPTSGYYLVVGKYRVADNSASTSEGIGIGPSAVDNPDFRWAQTEGMRQGHINTLIKHYTAGDVIFLYCYIDNSSSVAAASLQIKQLPISLVSSVSGNNGGTIAGGATALAQLTDVDFTAPPTNGQTLVWNSTESKFVPTTPAAVTTAPWTVEATGTGISQNITLPVSGLDPKAVLVFVDGLKMKASAYTISGTTLTMMTNAMGDDIEIVGGL